MINFLMSSRSDQCACICEMRAFSLDAVDIDDPLLDARHAGDAGCLVVVLDGDEGHSARGRRC